MNTKLWSASVTAVLHALPYYIWLRKTAWLYLSEFGYSIFRGNICGPMFVTSDMPVRAITTGAIASFGYGTKSSHLSIFPLSLYMGGG